MSDLGEPNGNGETDAWRLHAARHDAVVALERRLNLLETLLREGFRDVSTMLGLVRADIQAQRDEVKDLHKRWVRVIDRQTITDNRVAALETKPRRKKNK